jgi:MoxR-like ATPase
MTTLNLTPERRKETDAALAQLKKKYVFSDNVIDAIGVAVRTGKNILLYGPGGHAKSDLAEAVAMIYYQSTDVYIGQMGRGATIESLLGYANVAKLITGDAEGNSVREFNHESSFMARKIALFDELLDTPTMLLEYLKDILTRGMYCANGTMCFKSQTEVIIACTNRDPLAWASEGSPEDQSSKTAFLGRFPIKVEVSWPRYGQMEFTSLFNAIYSPDKVKAGKLAVIAELVSKSHKKGVFISPRDARHVADLYLSEGVTGIKNSGIPKEVLNHVIEQEKQIEKDFEALQKLEPVKKMIEEVHKEVMACNDYMELIQWEEDLKQIGNVLASINVGEHAVMHLGELRTKVARIQHDAKEKAAKVRTTKPNNLLAKYNIQL